MFKSTVFKKYCINRKRPQPDQVHSDPADAPCRLCRINATCSQWSVMGHQALQSNHNWILSDYKGKVEDRAHSLKSNFS
ncbi:hypothetical protein KIN20_037545 [Parelaphostrongylus tenuis]|uniref:Uncharacterized protein n=1 Tax=Parelaphostrongylus tenuis TaxID=148309 RepID=A0AAD5WM65_PARTN|nr:hypothetical protein KIN20_037545 [Parelaphostrongylus tenuis]